MSATDDVDGSPSTLHYSVRGNLERRAVMGTVTIIGLDIAKSVFQVHGVDAQGEAVVRPRVRRRRTTASPCASTPCT